MIKLIMKIYALVRTFWDKPRPVTDATLENTFKINNMYEFSKIINNYPYVFDGIRGLIDKTESAEHFFDKDIKYGRDCDDWARMWSYWGIYNGYKPTEYIVLNPKHPFSTAHVITALEKDGEFVLCNYSPIKLGFKNIDEIMEYMKRYSSYKDGLLYVKYQEFTLDDIKNPE